MRDFPRDKLITYLTPPPQPAAPQPSGYSFAQSLGTAPLAVTIPATASIGDICLLFANRLSNSAGSSVAPTISSGPAFTLITGFAYPGGATFAGACALFFRKLQSGDPGSTVSLAATGGYDICGQIRTYPVKGIDNFLSAKTVSSGAAELAALAPAQSKTPEITVNFTATGQFITGVAPLLAPNGNIYYINPSGRTFANIWSSDWFGTMPANANQTPYAGGSNGIGQVAVTLLSN